MCCGDVFSPGCCLHRSASVHGFSTCNMVVNTVGFVGRPPLVSSLPPFLPLCEQGMQMQITTNKGQLMNVTIPQGAQQGQPFQIYVPA